MNSALISLFLASQSFAAGTATSPSFEYRITTRDGVAIRGALVALRVAQETKHLTLRPLVDGVPVILPQWRVERTELGDRTAVTNAQGVAAFSELTLAAGRNLTFYADVMLMMKAQEPSLIPPSDNLVFSPRAEGGLCSKGTVANLERLARVINCQSVDDAATIGARLQHYRELGYEVTDPFAP